LAARAAVGHFADARQATIAMTRAPSDITATFADDVSLAGSLLNLTPQCALPVDIARTALRHAPVLIL
jgi:hypothetical protein